MLVHIDDISNEDFLHVKCFETSFFLNKQFKPKQWLNFGELIYIIYENMNILCLHINVCIIFHFLEEEKKVVKWQKF